MKATMSIAVVLLCSSAIMSAGAAAKGSKKIRNLEGGTGGTAQAQGNNHGKKKAHAKSDGTEQRKRGGKEQGDRRGQPSPG